MPRQSSCCLATTRIKPLRASGQPDAAVGKPEPSSWGLLGTKVGDRSAFCARNVDFAFTRTCLLPRLSLQRLDKGAAYAGAGACTYSLKHADGESLILGRLFAPRPALLPGEMISIAHLAGDCHRLRLEDPRDMAAGEPPVRRSEVGGHPVVEPEGVIADPLINEAPLLAADRSSSLGAVAELRRGCCRAMQVGADLLARRHEVGRLRRVTVPPVGQDAIVGPLQCAALGLGHQRRSCHLRPRRKGVWAVEGLWEESTQQFTASSGECGLIHFDAAAARAPDRRSAPGRYPGPQPPRAVVSPHRSHLKALRGSRRENQLQGPSWVRDGSGTKPWS
jgi:hypothetical protein